MIRPFLINNRSFHIYNSMGFFKPLLFIHHFTIPISEKKIPLVMCLHQSSQLSEQNGVSPPKIWPLYQGT